MNKSVFKTRRLQGTLIQLMALVTTVKWQIKSVKNDYSKFYMLQVMLFITLRIRNNYFDGTKYHRTWVLSQGHEFILSSFFSNIFSMQFPKFSVIQFCTYAFFSFLFFVYFFFTLFSTCAPMKEPLKYS